VTVVDVHVHAVSEVTPGDAGVEGVYRVELDDDVPVEEQADVALDVFNYQVPIDVLDNFELYVSAPGSQSALPTLDDWIPYSGKYRGRIINEKTL
jgi:hypothetical protein